MDRKMKTGIVISILPYLLALMLFYSLAIHMHQSLGGWPGIGTDGFPQALLIHDKIQGFYISYLLLFTIFVVPAIILVCLLVPRWRQLVVYCLVHLVSLPIFFVLMQLAPEGYLYWWWDWRYYDQLRPKRKETAALLRKHGGKRGKELKAEGIWNTSYSQQSQPCWLWGVVNNPTYVFIH